MRNDNRREAAAYNTLCRDAIYGTAVGDALGVPALGYARRDLIRRPVLSMQEYSSNNRFQKGTWTSVTSFMLATADSVSEKNSIDLDSMMHNYIGAVSYGKYSVDRKIICLSEDVHDSLTEYRYGRKSARRSGKNSEDCGVISRVLPVIMFVISESKSDKESLSDIHDVCSMTNDNWDSRVACGLYYFLIKSVMFARNETLDDRVNTPLLKILQSGVDEAKYYYQSTMKDVEPRAALKRFQTDLEVLSRKPANQIEPSNTVISEMTSVLWALCNGKDYEETLLKLANFGGEANSRCAFAGGIAGLYYGFRGIPSAWKDSLRHQDTINDIIKKL